MSGDHESDVPAATSSQELTTPELPDQPGRAMQLRATRGAALTRALQAQSVATSAPVAPAGIAGLGLATVLLFLNSTLLSLGDTAAGNDVSLRDAALAVVLGFTTLWWHGVPQSKGPPVLTALCVLVLVAVSAGWLDASTVVRAMNGIYAVLILGSAGLRLSSLQSGAPSGS